ncbi:AAA family ATPase [Pseudomonas sp. FP1154]|uniref:AAA family ATPase n=1 Tax=unclassified Pseudomonas TaxID=196821 RepID=UPI00136AA938|nr:MULTISPECIES: AAA family ATPase [unclassified Pseudomonas]MXR29395.1 AAA family ATPase [Pseudomonas sp. PICF6]WLG24490.1 AAA family ATPase [Pseudomonas sp. FP1154]WNZ79811.1 AAA family ATPase [Pseudomonas sp. P105]
MQIQHLEIANFRKLLSVRIDLASETTLLVGANNSGKSSAMLALRKFLLSKASVFRLQDLTLSHLATIDSIGEAWEGADSSFPIPVANDWADWLPTLDVWLEASQGELHHIRDLIPNFTWKGGHVGMRFRLEPDEMTTLFVDYRKERERVKLLQQEIQKQAAQGTEPPSLPLWPQSLHDYLNRRIGRTFKIRWYRLDPGQLQAPDPVTRKANQQALAATATPLERNPLTDLIRIHEINAQRGFGDSADEGVLEGGHGSGRKLSEQLRAYYSRHLDPGDSPDVSDLEALRAIEAAQTAFDTRLSTSFAPALQEVAGLGYPNNSDPSIRVATRLAPTDGMNHEAAVLFELDSVGGAPGAPPLRLPETSNGLGYQNLISMIFRLMAFRDEWLKKYRSPEEQSATGVEPIHLVLIEEPEAHLHVQVQQAFIKHAYHVLCSDPLLEKYSNLRTQLVVSSHSSHVAHEIDYENLRYFRRLPSGMAGVPIPVSTVSNLSTVFGKPNQTKEFVTRYLRAQHADLFFADAVILVEGAAERMMLPHFLRQHFRFLDQCYITILDIGGSHAHRLRPLIDALGIVTLVITDLDAGILQVGKPVERKKGQSTNNPTVRHWMRAAGLGHDVDSLLDLPFDSKAQQIDDLFSIRIAYQTPITIRLPKTGMDVEALPNTFEDSLVLSNTEHFAGKAGRGLTRSFAKALREAETSLDLGTGLFTKLKDGDKAEFALHVLGDSNFTQLTVPTYIHEGLTWLQSKLERKSKELLVIPSAIVEVTP